MSDLIRLYNQNVWGWEVKNRLFLIKELIENYQPDVCTFQEFNPVNVRNAPIPLQRLLADGYQEACGELSPTTHVAVFYKKDKFEEIKSGLKLFSGKNDVQSKGVLWAVLKNVETGRLFAVASTHFWWKAEDEQDALQRRENARELAAVCREIQAEYQVPVIIGGDLNSGYGSMQGASGYEEMLAQGMLDLRHQAKLTTNMHTVHGYPLLQKDQYVGGGFPTETIDYVFSTSTPSVRAHSFSVLTEPMALASSDHCPLLVELEIV